MPGLRRAPDPDKPAALRQAFGGAYVADNGYDREMALRATASGNAAMITFGKAFIANPDLVARLRANAPLATAPPAVLFGGGAEGYTDFPTL